jgi:hypothetical protein
MRRKLLIILFLVLAVPIGAVEVPCGTWIELRANPVEDWHFDHWSDGNTDAIRQLEVRSDTVLYAHFAPNCGDYAALPVIALYDWLLMLDVRSINAKGYYFAEEAVTWYRVRGVPDKIDEDVGHDDEMMTVGYSLTIDQSMVGTGDYYAIVDVSGSPAGVLCNGLMRSEMVHYAASAPTAPVPILEPTYVRPREPQRLLHLDPELPTTVTVYDAAGRRIEMLTADNAERLAMQAAGVAGCYQVVVQNGDQRTVLRYIVVK